MKNSEKNIFINSYLYKELRKSKGENVDEIETGFTDMEKATEISSAKPVSQRYFSPMRKTKTKKDGEQVVTTYVPSKQPLDVLQEEEMQNRAKITIKRF